MCRVPGRKAKDGTKMMMVAAQEHCMLERMISVAINIALQFQTK